MAMDPTARVAVELALYNFEDFAQYHNLLETKFSQNLKRAILKQTSFNIKT